MDSAYNHLDPALLALYAELLEQLLEASGEGTPPKGSLVEKTVKGRTYLYLQFAALGERKQIYLGPDSEALRGELQRLDQVWRDRDETRQSAATLVSMLAAGGAQGPDSASGRVLEVLAEHGIFDVGAVLVGSHAFSAYGAMLGVAWREGYRTQDIDLAAERRVTIGVTRRGSVPTALADTRFDFRAVPGLDPREPSTTWRVRGRPLRLDILTPLRGKPGGGAVELPNLGVYAWPLRFLDFLIEEVVPAGLIYKRGVRVSVPSPARYALHKLLVAQERGVHEQAKARKDLLQASALLELLGDERPGDLERAWANLSQRGAGWLKRVERSAAGLTPGARAHLDALRA